jgi:hypothetical protein
MIRLIFYVILFYLIYRTIKYLTGLVSTPQERKNDHINNVKEKKSHYNIDQKDIIDAKFEEIKPDKDEKNTGSEEDNSSDREKPGNE